MRGSVTLQTIPTGTTGAPRSIAGCSSALWNSHTRSPGFDVPSRNTVTDWPNASFSRTFAEVSNSSRPVLRLVSGWSKTRTIMPNSFMSKSIRWATKYERFAAAMQIRSM